MAWRPVIETAGQLEQRGIAVHPNLLDDIADRGLDAAVVRLLAGKQLLQRLVEPGVTAV